MPTPPPPPGPPWDLPVSEAPIAFVDLEMTGLDPKADRVVEVCVERWVGDTRVACVETLIDPVVRAGGAAHVHGLSAEVLAGAPRFAQIVPEVLPLLDGAVFVAHAASWDLDFLRAELSRSGHELSVSHWLDTLTLSRRAFGFPSCSMDALCTQFSIPRDRAHRAGDDVRALREVFLRCVAALGPVSMRDLWEVRVAARRARAAILESCERAIEYGAPVFVTYRPSRKPAERLEMVLTGVVADLDPPRLLGYLLPGRGRRELRADRILKVESSPSEQESP